ncbi:MmyB family transcriptional regulator [Streptosporangium sp. LJ11]|uniref:MmyB family transcriptional regulator n=1 Tax=Streptosporangium sp. LJ11 TaxID=3436927 RepID=UPI003F78CBCF
MWTTASASAALFEDFSALAGQERNIIRRYFLHPDPEHRHYGMGGPERFVVTAVSYLRLAVTRYPDDPELKLLVDELVAGSEEFARLWNSHRFHIERHLHQTVRHPQVGPIELDFDVLTVPD